MGIGNNYCRGVFLCVYIYELIMRRTDFSIGRVYMSGRVECIERT